MPPRRLGEGAGVGQERRDAGSPTARVEAVDEAPERIEREVLAERHREREDARIEGAPSAHLVVRKAEQHAVGHVERRPREPPAAPSRDRLPEDRDVGVVAAEDPAVDGLLQRPDGGGNTTRPGITGSASMAVQHPHGCTPDRPWPIKGCGGL